MKEAKQIQKIKAVLTERLVPFHETLVIHEMNLSDLAKRISDELNPDE